MTMRMGGLAAVTAIAVAVGLGLTALAPGPASGATRPQPPCTRRALQAGLERGFATVSHGTVVRPFGCRDGWAYSAVNTKRFTLSSLFRVHDGRWRTAVRTGNCEHHRVPRKIFKPACESN